jgi:hypothetical protein
MFVFLVTGVSGAGKSTLARRMAAWGHHTVSADGDPLLSGWTDLAGNPVQRPVHPDTVWLARHEWRWNPDRLDALIADALAADATALWVFGRADNALLLLDRFDAVFLLDVDLATATRRMTDPARGNDYGRVGDSLHAAIDAAAGFRGTWLEAGVVPVDATQPVDATGHQLLAEAAMAALRRHR